MQETGFDPWAGKIPWRREWLPTPVFLPGEFHGEVSLVGYSPWGRKESDMTDSHFTFTLFSSCVALSEELTTCYIHFSVDRH